MRCAINETARNNKQYQQRRKENKKNRTAVNNPAVKSKGKT